MKLFILLLASLLPFQNSSAQDRAKNFIDQNFIEVVGTAEMEVMPDEIYMRIIVKETDKPKRTVEEAEKLLIETMSAMNIAINSDLTVIDFLSSTKVSFLNRDIITSKQYQLLLHDAETVAKVFNVLESKGFTNMSIIRFDHTRMDNFKMEVRQQAIKAAKDKAKNLMVAIGQDIGKALYVEELRAMNGNLPYTSNVSYNTQPMNGEDKVGSLNFQSIALKFSILVRFEIK